ncbi:Acrosin [Lonchura striata]|uniref:Acrosin n=1 Tax=Lonchura striata TaxID=40157 RepID=A0A218U772_9PASE|nr:Acrosin [Lonchura striata domestica]
MMKMKKNQNRRPPGPRLVLQEAKVRLMDVQLCNSSRWYGGAVQPQDLCAGYPRGGIDTCQGDIGGPLVCKDKTRDYFWLVGLASWGKGCAGARRPGIFTSTQRFHSWIRAHAGPSPTGPAPAPKATLNSPEPPELVPPKLEPPKLEPPKLEPPKPEPSAESSHPFMDISFPKETLTGFLRKLQEHGEHRENREKREHREKREKREKRENPENREHREHREKREKREKQENRENREHRENRGNRQNRELR